MIVVHNTKLSFSVGMLKAVVRNTVRKVGEKPSENVKKNQKLSSPQRLKRVTIEKTKFSREQYRHQNK